MADPHRFTRRKPKGKIQSVKNAFAKAARMAAVGAVVVAGVGAIGYDQYGTTKTETCKMHVDVTTDWDKNWNEVDTYKVSGCGHDFNDSAAKLHGKFGGHKFDKNMKDGGTYDITYYGGLTRNPNLIAAHYVSPAELKARAEKQKKAEAAAKKKQQEGQGKPGGTNGGTKTTPGTGGNTGNTGGKLSGAKETVWITSNGYNIQITIPVEADGQVTVNTVSPTVKPAATPTP
jgi:hypothetical protein